MTSSKSGNCLPNLPCHAGRWDIRESVVIVADIVPQILVTRDPRRFALGVSCHQVGATRITTNPAATSGQGLALTVNETNWYDWEHQGGWVQQDLYVVNDSPAVIVTVVEVVIRPGR